MIEKKVKDLVAKGEGIDVEFKTSLYKLNRNVFETICAFLNRGGGHLLLGVSDSGEVEGVLEDSIQSIINDIVFQANNPQLLNPPFYLTPEVVKIEDKSVIFVFVPESSQVHDVKGKIFDRNEDGDLEITRHSDQVTQLYLRKQSTYSENKIFPYVEITDFKEELFPRVRNLAKNERPDHPWGQ